MAKHLDLEEQEQLAELKHFWKQYGDIITWVLIGVFGSVAAWNGYQYWQGRQASQAAVMHDEVDRAVQSGDAARLDRSLADMKERFSGTIYAEQAALLAAAPFARLKQTRTRPHRRSCRLIFRTVHQVKNLLPVNVLRRAEF